MRKFVFVDRRFSSPTAFAKVAFDIVLILKKHGFVAVPLYRWVLNVRGTQRILGLLWWLYAKFILWRFRAGDVIVLQYPDLVLRWERFGLPLLNWLKTRGCKLVVLIHDIDMPRFNGDKDIEKGSEFLCKIIENAYAVISHNTAMRRWLNDRGVADGKIVELGVFDYLSDEAVNVASCSRDVIVAGNLRPEKALYASHLREIKGITWKIYSGFYDEKEMGGENVVYCGTCPSDEFPSKLSSGFGLVWDGDSIDGLEGNAGVYNSIVSPHKLSLYLTSGLPVIVCNKAESSKFVLSNDVGFAVSSLREIPAILAAMTSDRYDVMARNARKIAEKMRSGFYTKTAINKALEIINE